MTKEQYELLACYLQVLGFMNAPSSMSDDIAKAVVAIHSGPHKQMPIDDLAAIKQLALSLASYHIRQFVPYIIQLLKADYERNIKN